MIGGGAGPLGVEEEDGVGGVHRRESTAPNHHLREREFRQTVEEKVKGKSVIIS